MLENERPLEVLGVKPGDQFGGNLPEIDPGLIHGADETIRQGVDNDGNAPTSEGVASAESHSYERHTPLTRSQYSWLQRILPVQEVDKLDALLPNVREKFVDGIGKIYLANNGFSQLNNKDLAHRQKRIAQLKMLMAGNTYEDIADQSGLSASSSVHINFRKMAELINKITSNSENDLLTELIPELDEDALKRLATIHKYGRRPPLRQNGRQTRGNKPSVRKSRAVENGNSANGSAYRKRAEKLRDQEDLSRVFEKAKNGDPEAINRLCGRYCNRIFGIAKKIGLNEHDAENVVQDVLILLCDNLHKIRKPGALGSWLNVVSRHHSLKYRIGLNDAEQPDLTITMTGQSFDINGGSVMRQIPDGDSQIVGGSRPLLSPEEFVERDELNRQLSQAIDSVLGKLSVNQSKILIQMLRSPDTLYDDAAEELEIPVGSIGPTRRRVLGKIGAELLDLGYRHDTNE